MSGVKKNTDRPVLMEAIGYCITNKIKCLLVSELSGLGRNALEILDTIKLFIDNGINLHMQKERSTLLDKEGRPAMFAPIMIVTLSTCTQLKRENTKSRLNPGRKLYIERGNKLGRKIGPVESSAQKKEKYGEVISYLKKSYSIRSIAKLVGKGISTVQKIEQELN